ncbi:MAG: hypothetical protein FJ224_04790 [Lentisphaerae bacterium]|nr:hypothetical protein [Lentisphaerota bacterium]
MGTDRQKLKAKPGNRPKKSERERRRRVKNQVKRLVGLGCQEADLKHMNPSQMRAKLRQLERK